MKERIFENRLAERATDDTTRREELKALAKEVVVIIRQGLVEDGMVRIHGFGTFRLTQGKPRTTTNPQTGEKITVPARNRVSFRPAKALRERIEPDAGATIVLSEPAPSREAILGGRMVGVHAAGRLPEHGRTDDDHASAIAAARIEEPIIRAPGPPVPPQPQPAQDDAATVVDIGDATRRRQPAREPEPRREPEPELDPAIDLGTVAPVGAHAPAAAAPEAPRGQRRRPAVLLLALLLVMLGAMALWLWPRGLDTQPMLATEPEAPATEPEVPVTDPDIAAGATDPEAVQPPADDDEAAPATGETEAVAVNLETIEPLDVEVAETAEPAPPATDEATAPAGVEEPLPAPEGVPDSLATAEAVDRATARQINAEATPAGGPYFAARSHEVNAGDTLWGLADRHYVNPYLWPHIYNQNAELTNPDRILTGQEITLPALHGEPGNLTDADRRSIAEGYLRLYEFWRRQGRDNAHYALVGVQHFDAAVLPTELETIAAGADDPVAALFAALTHGGD